MLAAIKTLLEDTASAQGLNFAFVSFKEINDAVEELDLNKSTILVNSTIKGNHKKSQGGAYNQVYEVNLACIKKREVEASDADVFTIISTTELDFLTYLNIVSESPILNGDLNEFEITTIYFPAAAPTAGTKATIKMKTVGRCS